MSNFDNNYNLDGEDLVFYTDISGGIYSGGFSVNSIMMKGEMTPLSSIKTQTNNVPLNNVPLNNVLLNDNSIDKIFNGGELMSEKHINKVSDLFDNLAVPSWLLSYNTNFIHDDLNDKTNDLNGGSNYKNYKNYKKENMDLNEDSDNDEIDDDLYNKLLDLVKVPNKKGHVEGEGEGEGERERKNTENKIKEEKQTKKKTRRQVNNDKSKTKTKKNKK